VAPSRLRPLPGLLLTLTVLAELAAVVLSWRLEPAYDTLLNVVFSCAFAGTGFLILSRHPRHVIGWLLLAVGVENALALDLAQGYGLRAAAEGWPGGPVAEAIVMAGWLPQAPAFVLIVLLFPTDRLPGRRWWLVVWMSVLGVALAEPGWVLNPLSGGEYAAGPNPYAVEGPLPDVLFVIGFTLTATALLTAFVGALVRFRRSIGVERQQLKWFALSTGVLVVIAAPALVFWEATPVVPLLAAVCLTVWPVTIGIAVLRYRLYDVDLVLSRTFNYLMLTVVLAVVYAAAVVVLGAVVGRDEAWVTAGATLLAAASFKLLHRRVQDRVDRRFRPGRHRALSVVAAFTERLRHDQAEPEGVVDALRDAMGDPGARAAVRAPAGRTAGRHTRPPGNRSGCAWPRAVPRAAWWDGPCRGGLVAERGEEGTARERCRGSRLADRDGAPPGGAPPASRRSGRVEVPARRRG